MPCVAALPTKHTHTLFLPRRCRIGFVSSARWGEICSFDSPCLGSVICHPPSGVLLLPSLVPRLSAHRAESLGTRLATSWIPFSLSGSGRIPDLSTNSHLSLFSVSPADSKRWRMLRKRLSCSFWVLPWTTTSSMIQTTPSNPFRISDILRWKCSGAEVIPNGKRRNQ